VDTDNEFRATGTFFPSAGEPERVFQTHERQNFSRWEAGLGFFSLFFFWWICISASSGRTTFFRARDLRGPFFPTARSKKITRTEFDRKWWVSTPGHTPPRR
jgi:hypothetical protein